MTMIVLAALSVMMALVTGQSYHIVSTKLGQVRGQLHRVDHSDVYKFLGIHYAESPTGANRFSKPIPRKPWTGVLPATRLGPHCVQRTFDSATQSEDCLVLNIFVPRTLSVASPRSVMLWVHGGGYTGGYGGDASHLAVIGDVIVVTVNYRLGTLGFLSTFDDNMRGNFGLYDQLESIKFVKHNIAAFGGNPNSITIFGESAGGYSVGLLALSPLSKGLFQRVISESGVGISPRAVSFDAHTFLNRFSDSIGCNSKNNDGSLNTNVFKSCVRDKTINDIQKAQGRSGYDAHLTWRLIIAPTVDGELIPQTPEELLYARNSQLYNPLPDLDILAGTNNMEGSLMVSKLNSYHNSLNFSLHNGIPTRVLCNNIAPSLSKDYLDDNKVLSQGICNLYTTDGAASTQGRSVLSMYGDMMFVATTHATLMQHSKHSSGRRSYVYLFSQQRHNSTTPSWMTGADHGADVSYIFGYHVLDRSLSRQMMAYWTNFAKYGDPNGIGSSSTGLHWPQFDEARKAYISFGPHVEVKHNLWPQRINFWTKTVPNTLGRLARGLEPNHILIG